MRATTHELIGVGLALGGARLAHADVAATVGIAAVAFYGSWLPDADRAGTRVRRRTRAERRHVTLGAAGLVLRLPMRLFGLVARHRGVTHSLAATALLTLLAWLAAAPLGAGAARVAGAGMALGYGGHVAADACTPGGVALLAPLTRRRMWLAPRAARIPTGSRRESLLVGCLLAGAFATAALH